MRLKKKTNFNHTVFFGVVEEGAGEGWVVLELGRPWEGGGQILFG